MKQEVDALTTLVNIMRASDVESWVSGPLELSTVFELAQRDAEQFPVSAALNMFPRGAKCDHLLILMEF